MQDAGRSRQSAMRNQHSIVPVKSDDDSVPRVRDPHNVFVGESGRLLASRDNIMPVIPGGPARSPAVCSRLRADSTRYPVADGMDLFVPRAFHRKGIRSPQRLLGKLGITLQNFLHSPAFREQGGQILHG